MKKSAYVSLVVYLIYVVLGIIMIIEGIEQLNAPPKENPDMPVTYLVGGIILLIGLVFLGLKGLHLGTKFGLFSIICALGDGFGVYFIWWTLVMDCHPIVSWISGLDAETITRAIPFMVISLLPATAFISNIASIKRN